MHLKPQSQATRGACVATGRARAGVAGAMHFPNACGAVCIGYACQHVLGLHTATTTQQMRAQPLCWPDFCCLKLRLCCANQAAFFAKGLILMP